MRRSPIRKISVEQKERNIKKADETKELHKLFRIIWDEQEDETGCCYCFESGVPLHGSNFRHRTACYHHVLEKGEGSYPQYTLTKENIIIVSPEVHEKVGNSIENCPKIKAYREYLLNLHYENKLLKKEEN